VDNLAALGNEKKDMRSFSSVKLKQAEGLMIPKHRFDCVNLCLKETKQALRDKIAEAEADKLRAATLEKELLDAKVDKELAIHRARNLIAVRALIDFSVLSSKPDGSIAGLESQIRCLKEKQDYLFEAQENISYVLVPVKPNDTLNKSMANYIKRGEVRK